jgi:hypothetical protein
MAGAPVRGRPARRRIGRPDPHAFLRPELVVRRSSLSILIFLFCAAGLEGQQRPGVEVRSGIVVPLGGFQQGLVPDTELAPGPGFAVHLQLPHRTRSALFLGFSHHRLRCSGAGCGDAGTLESTAWNIGGKYALSGGGAAPWIRLAMLLDRSEGDFLEEGETVRRASYLGLGGEVGAGLSIHLGERLILSPGVRYAALDTRFPRFGRVRMRYAVGDLALTIGF